MKKRMLRELFEAIHHSKYLFEDFMTISVGEHYQKVSWRDRNLYKASKKLKAFHAFLNAFVLEYTPLNERVSFAYRKGATVVDAIRPHAQSSAFFQGDIQRFFDCISSADARRAILASSAPIEDLERYVDRIVELTTVDGRLPIGFATSPLLSNSCMKAFDDLFEALCAERRWIYTRYADDIIVSAGHRNELREVEGVLVGSLRDTVGSAYSLRGEKTKYTSKGRNIQILGMSLLPNGRITIGRQLREKVETQLHFYLSDRARLTQVFNGDPEAGLQRLSGYICHIKSADPEYLEKLRKKFGTTVIDSFLRRVVK